MKLHSPAFEKSLRRAARRRIFASPAFKREYRRAGRRRLASTQVRGFGPIAFSLVLAGFVYALVGSLPGPDTALALISLLAFLMVNSREQALVRYLYRSADLYALSLLPLTPRDIFRWEFGNFLRESLYSLLMIIGAFFGIILGADLSPWQALAIIPIAVLTWLNVLALAFFCAAHLRRHPFMVIRRYLVFGVILLVGTGFFAAKFFGVAAVLPFVDRYAPWLLVVLPTGWPASLARLLFPGSHWIDLLLLFPTLGILWTLRDSLRTLLSRYEFRELTRPVLRDVVPVSTPRAAPRSANPAATAPLDPSVAPARVGPTAIAEIIQSRVFFAPSQWQDRGWFEKMFWRWLTPGERALSEIMFPDGVTMTNRWKRIFLILAVAIALEFIARSIMPGLRGLFFFIGMFVASCMAPATVLNSGRMFQYHRTSGVFTPAYVYFPVGWREISRLLLKYSTVQFPAVLVLAAVCGMLALNVAELPLPFVIFNGFQYGFRAAVVLFSLRLLLLVFSFSSGSNDTQRFRLHAFFLVCCMLVLVGAFLGLALTGVFLLFPARAWLLTALALFDAWLLWLVYGWFYHGKFFDLVRSPPR